MSEFQKHDQGKTDMSYIIDFAPEFEAVCKALEYGGKKYGRSNWQNGTPERYMAAAMRHLMGIGESDTGSHLAQAMANILFLMALER